MSSYDNAIRLLEQALFLRQNGERPPGAPRDDPEAETWRDWDRRAEAFLRKYHRATILVELYVRECELSPDVMKAMDDDALAGHLRDAHPGTLIDLEPSVSAGHRPEAPPSPSLLRTSRIGPCLAPPCGPVCRAVRRPGADPAAAADPRP